MTREFLTATAAKKVAEEHRKSRQNAAKRRVHEEWHQAITSAITSGHNEVNIPSSKAKFTANTPPNEWAYEAEAQQEVMKTLTGLGYTIMPVINDLNFSHKVRW